LGVGVHPPTCEALKLPFARSDDTLPDRLRALPFGLRDDVLELDPGDLDLNIDAIEEGA